MPNRIRFGIRPRRIVRRPDAPEGQFEADGLSLQCQPLGWPACLRLGSLTAARWACPDACDGSTSQTGRGRSTCRLRDSLLLRQPRPRRGRGSASEMSGIRHPSEGLRAARHRAVRCPRDRGSEGLGPLLVTRCDRRQAATLARRVESTARCRDTSSGRQWPRSSGTGGLRSVPSSSLHAFESFLDRLVERDRGLEYVF